ncbi:dynein light chain Tctex-type 5-like [Lytechinus variegatus]|uniref:dynein light chain Tctex-type 5-like n=1 Tax=Lytechinus variegatus TaxID=7654 RepID=UPI001BB17BF7|nr:dynein light chain Tctex-type 5-like [Lytechinus variegatus]
MKKGDSVSVEGGSRIREKEVAKPRKVSQLIEANLSLTSTRGRTLTFSDVASDRESEASTSTQRRRPAPQRDRAASLMNLKRGASLYFGKDITTSMWWKYRQIHGGIEALRGDHGGGHGGALEYENSYQLEPKSGHKFAPGKVEECIREVLGYVFENEVYDPKRAAILAAAISDAVKQKVKMLCGLDRYRLVVNVDIGSRVPGQEVVIASRYLWNTDTDGFATVSSQNRTMYSVVTVYAVYMD